MLFEADYAKYYEADYAKYYASILYQCLIDGDGSYRCVFLSCKRLERERNVDDGCYCTELKTKHTMTYTGTTLEKKKNHAVDA